MRRTAGASNDTTPLLPLAKKDSKQYKGFSFMEKWKDRQAQHFRGETEPKGHLTMMAIAVFHAPSYIYVMMNYMAPFLFADYHPWTRYYFKIFLWFICFNILVNYLFTMLYSSFYLKTKDNPYLDINNRENGPPETFQPLIQQRNTCLSNGHLNGGSTRQNMVIKDGELDWTVCEKCDIYVPPRAYHCRFCKKCVLKRDHHCFVVGCCIGFRNQRYFIVMLFYCLVVAVVAGGLTIRYIQHEVWPTSASWLDYVLPVTVYKCLVGKIGPFEMVVISHCYIYVLYLLFGLVYFPSQITFAAQGKTMLEIAKKIPIKNLNSRAENLKSVFGDFWALNFIFPMVLVFRQRDDGVRWENVRTDYNSNQITEEYSVAAVL